MLKLGVYRVDQYPHTRGGRLAWLRKNRVDYRLLRTCSPPSAFEVKVFESIMREMRLSSGVFRTTSPGRFRDLDLWLNPVLEKQFARETALEVHDWAASDCITSAAWYECLKEVFPHVCLTASDLNLHLIEMHVTGQGSYVFEANGEALQFIGPPFVIRLIPPEPALLLVNRILAWRAQARLKRLREKYKIDQAAIVFPDGAEEVRCGPLVFRRIPLVHPQAMALSRATRSFCIEQHSVFEPADRPVHVIRTMNVLNTGYFDSAMLDCGARSVWRSLLPRGIWIVGHTVQEAPSIHHVSVLMKAGNGFELLERYIEKSEIEHLTLALRV